MSGNRSSAIRVEPNVTPMIDLGEAVIGLDTRGRLYLDKIPVDTATLRRALGNRFRARPDDRVVFLRADESLPFSQLQETMELASSSGARVVGLVSSTPGKGSKGERK